MLLGLTLGFRAAVLRTFASAPSSFGHAARRRALRSRNQFGLRAVQVNEKTSGTVAQPKDTQERKDMLEFETAKFNLLWMKLQEAKEQKSPDVAEMKKEIEKQGEIVESLGGSLPAEMLTLEQAAERAEKLRADLSFDKLMKMTNEERWILAQGLGPAFPISLILSYTLYWVLNVPFIAYAYFTTVATGMTNMGVVMAGAYATSIPFKPLIYIGGLLGVPWVADNIMPWLGKVFNLFRLPDANDWDLL